MAALYPGAPSEKLVGIMPSGFLGHGFVVAIAAKGLVGILFSQDYQFHAVR